MAEQQTLQCWLVFQATRPVQNYLKMPYDEIREQQQTARHLPLPLYVLYMQASAYQQACGKTKSWIYCSMQYDTLLSHHMPSGIIMH